MLNAEAPRPQAGRGVFIRHLISRARQCRTSPASGVAADYIVRKLATRSCDAGDFPPSPARGVRVAWIHECRTTPSGRRCRSSALPQDERDVTQPSDPVGGRPWVPKAFGHPTQGRCNRAIAKQLYLSSRAVERHAQATCRSWDSPTGRTTTDASSPASRCSADVLNDPLILTSRLAGVASCPSTSAEDQADTDTLLPPYPVPRRAPVT